MSSKHFFRKNKKNTSINGKKNQSPSNSRGITEGFIFFIPKINSAKLFRIYGKVLTVLVIFIFIITIVIVGYDFQKNLQIKQDIDSQRKALFRDLSFWENFISQNQNYRDAYFQASILEYKLGNISKARIYVEKGLGLDSNSENGRRIEDLLNR